jgi:uracil-DNA glycosylase
VARILIANRRAQILLIGEAPGRSSRPGSQPITSRRLALLAGLDLEEFLGRFARTNLLASWPGKQPGGKGDLFPRSRAREGFEVLAPRLAGYPAVVLLGRRVAGSSGIERDVPWLTWVRAPWGPGRVAVSPHPSGISRWWNEQENYDRAKGFWTDLSSPDFSV